MSEPLKTDESRSAAAESSGEDSESGTVELDLQQPDSEHLLDPGCTDEQEDKDKLVELGCGQAGRSSSGDAAPSTVSEWVFGVDDIACASAECDGCARAAQPQQQRTPYRPHRTLPAAAARLVPRVPRRLRTPTTLVDMTASSRSGPIAADESAEQSAVRHTQRLTGYTGCRLLGLASNMAVVGLHIDAEAAENQSCAAADESGTRTHVVDADGLMAFVEQRSKAGVSVDVDPPVYGFVCAFTLQLTVNRIEQLVEQHYDFADQVIAEE